MDIFTPVKKWLRTLNKAHRDIVASKAGVKPRFIDSIVSGATKNPGILNVQELYAVMIKEKQDELAKLPILPGPTPVDG